VAGTRGTSRVSSPQYRWYVGAQAVSLVGTSMSLTAIYWLTIHVANGHAVVLSALVAAQFLPLLLFSRRAGLIVARHRPVRVLLFTQPAQAAGSLAFAIPLLAGWVTVWYLCLLSFVLGCVIAVDLPARQMFMLDLVGNDELRRGTSLYSTITGLAKVGGPAIAGDIIAVSGSAAVFLCDAASYAAVVGVLAWLARGDHVASAPASAGATSARRLRWLLDLPRGIQVAALMALLVGGIGYQFEVTNPLVATKVFHLSSVGFGLLGTLMAVGGIAGNYYSSRRRDPTGAEFIGWAVLFGLAEVAAALVPTAWAYAALMIVLGGATSLFATSCMVYVQQHAPAGQQAQALTAFNAGFLGFVPAGSFVVAGLAAVAGPRSALLVPGAAVLITGVCALTVMLRSPALAAAGSGAVEPGAAQDETVP
jgi:MFS family permease